MNKSTALLIIDVQLCAFAGTQFPACHSADILLNSITNLIAAAREAELPVIYVQHCGTKDQLYAEGTEQWIIHPRISPLPVDTVVQKRQSSAFDGTELESILNEMHVDTVITCGLQSEFCVSNTSIAALDLGFNVYVAQDGHSTWSNDDDEAATIIQRQNNLLAERGAEVETITRLVELACASKKV